MPLYVCEVSVLIIFTVGAISARKFVCMGLPAAATAAFAKPAHLGKWEVVNDLHSSGRGRVYTEKPASRKINTTSTVCVCAALSGLLQGWEAHVEDP